MQRNKIWINLQFEFIFCLKFFHFAQLVWRCDALATISGLFHLPKFQKNTQSHLKLFLTIINIFVLKNRNVFHYSLQAINQTSLSLMYVHLFNDVKCDANINAAKNSFSLSMQFVKIIFFKWAILVLFFVYFRLINTFDRQHSIYVLPMTEFEPWTSGVGSDRSTNWVTSTANLLNPFYVHFCLRPSAKDQDAIY